MQLLAPLHIDMNYLFIIYLLYNSFFFFTTITATDNFVVNGIETEKN